MEDGQNVICINFPMGSFPRSFTFVFELKLPTPGATVGTGPSAASTFPAAPAPRGPRASTPSLASLQRCTSSAGPLPRTDNSWQGLELTAVAASAVEPAPGFWLMVDPPHPTQRGSSLALSFPNPSENLFFCPEKANLCAPLPVTVPPAPAPSGLRAGPLPGGRASRPPSQWGVGKGRVGGEKGRRWGKGETRGSAERRGAAPSLLPLLLFFTGKPTSQAQKQLSFLHLVQAETVASNWDSLEMVVFLVWGPYPAVFRANS
ncbi:translation initiation factor IF-2-like [Sorex fumeus]|uniref:translation initiation factor IF-2-like n=1 Tax=Sorex fumeus TaxID=62283 RepID=UPI0024AD041C|nr:translation initiation factor IF-2-like [Sorex fumeus]